MNDIVSDQPPYTTTKLYADDLKCYNKITKDEDTIHFDETLEHINVWSLKWQLPIATQKCQVMCISNIKFPAVDSGLFCLGSHQLSDTTTSEDLGLIFNSSLNFHQHIQSICNKAKSQLFLLRKRFLSKNVKYLILAYKTYIVPVLNYCSPVWSPSTAGDILLIEKVQKFFTKKLSGYEELSYKDRLAKCGLRSLELMRLHTDLIYCYKILHNLIKIDKSLLFEIDPYCGPRSHGLQLRALSARTNLALHSFNYRVCNAWNKLSANTVWAPNLKMFKSYLYAEDLSELLTLDVNTFS
jgi:hypothetical protein